MIEVYKLGTTTVSFLVLSICKSQYLLSKSPYEVGGGSIAMSDSSEISEVVVLLLQLVVPRKACNVHSPYTGVV